MNPPPPRPWSPMSVGGLAISLLCFVPTVLAGFVLAVVIGLPLLGFAIATNDGEELVGVLMAVLLSSYITLVTSPVLALMGAVLHPVGIVAALLAARAGAWRSALLVIPPHVVMFGVDLAVGLFIGPTLLSMASG